MKLTIPTKDLRNILAQLAEMPGARAGADYSNAVRLSADMSGLIFTRFSAHARIDITSEITIEDTTGQPSVNHGLFVKAAGSMDARDTRIWTDENWLYMRSGEFKSKVMLYKKEEIDIEPPEPELEFESIKVPIEDLHLWLKAVAPAVHTDTKDNLNFCGICFRMSGDKLWIMATDRRQLHIIKEDYQLPVDAIIPSEAVDAIVNLTNKQTGACQLSFGENTVRVTTDRIESSFALLAGRFFAIESFIDKTIASRETKVTVNKEKLTEVLLKIAPFGEDKHKMVTLSLEKDSLRIRGDGEKHMAVESAIPCRFDNPMKDRRAPAAQLAQSISIISANDDGDIDLEFTLPSVIVQQPDRIVMVGLHNPLAKTNP